jgi:hypothetical protein
MPIIQPQLLRDRPINSAITVTPVKKARRPSAAVAATRNWYWQTKHKPIASSALTISDDADRATCFFFIRGNPRTAASNCNGRHAWEAPAILNTTPTTTIGITIYSAGHSASLQHWYT